VVRKYLAATIVGAMLLASQAAASSEVVSLSDRLGSNSASSDSLQGSETLALAAVAAVGIGLIAWGFTQKNNNGIPGSP
jgi:hypothetical protein